MKNLIGLFLILALSAAVFGQQPKAKPLAETFSATALDGESFDLAELKGKVVILTFWSTKCQICHSEIPKLNQLVETYKDKAVVFLGLTMENSDKVRAYLKKTPFKFDILPNSFGVVLKYADKDGDGNVAMGFPAHFLINQKGEIELKTSGFDKTKILDVEVNRLLVTK
jgi:peroxiredoxin